MSIWLKKRFSQVLWSETFEQFERDFMAAGGPKEMLLIEQKHAPLDQTLFMRVPATFAGRYQGFVEINPGELPRKATLLIGHADEFEQIFDYGQD